MRTWASCHRADAGLGARGFSLLELLVVLFLIGVMAAMAAPRLQRTYEAIASSGDRAEVVRQVERLPFIAREQVMPVELRAGEGARLMELLILPEGWSVEPVSAVRVEANGFCHPAVLRVRGGGTIEDWTVAAPDCALSDVL